MDKILVDRFYNLTDTMRKLAMSHFIVGGVSKSEFFMLQFIGSSCKDDGSVTTAVLSERLHISKPAVSQAINNLEKKEYVTREVCKNDRRLTSIILTEKGKNVLKEEEEKFLKRIDFVLDKMGKNDSETFICLLEKYFKIIKAVHKEDGTHL